MLLPKKLVKFLSKIKYETISHRTVYTAFDKAKTLKVPEKIVGKTLVLKMNGDFSLALISADQILDKEKFKKIVNNWRKKIGKKLIKEIDFATEAWMKKNLKGVKVGAIPPFGNLWKMPTFVERSLLKKPKIILNGGDYNLSIKINSSSLKKLIPDLLIGSFGKVKK
jgi:Ala-tRNA(Pro) deacylase